MITKNKYTVLDILFENAKRIPIFGLAKLKEQVELINFHKEKPQQLFLVTEVVYQYGMFGNESTYTDVYTCIL